MRGGVTVRVFFSSVNIFYIIMYFRINAQLSPIGHPQFLHDDCDTFYLFIYKEGPQTPSRPYCTHTHLHRTLPVCPTYPINYVVSVVRSQYVCYLFIFILVSGFVSEMAKCNSKKCLNVTKKHT